MARKATLARKGFTQALGTFVIGATVGSVIALLYAPASGRVTRQRLNLKWRAVKRSATQLREQAARKITYARQWMTSHANGNGHVRRPAMRRRVAQHA